jgi:thymidylate kinase
VIVSISGVDCSGKTTQLERLQDRFQAEGHGCEVVWFRPGYSRELDFLRSTVRRFKPGLLPRSDGDESRNRDEAFKSGGVRRSWVVMAILDSLVHYVLKLRVLSAGGKTVLCDRYLFDGRLDLELRFPEYTSSIRKAFDVLRRMAPIPDHAFLLMIPLEVMESRMAEKDEPFPDPVETRQMRFEAYQFIGSRPGVTVVDGHGDRDQVSDVIWEQVCASIR